MKHVLNNTGDMQYGVSATLMQMYASLIDYSNEICKERSEEYNLILSGSYSEIHAGCSLCACTEEEKWRAVVSQDLSREGRFFVLHTQSDVYRRPSDVLTRWTPQFVNTQFQWCHHCYNMQKKLKNKGTQKNERKEKHQSGIIISVCKTFHSFIIINCKVLLMHILSQHSCHMWSEDSEPVPRDNGTDIDNQEFLLCSSQHSHSSHWN